MPRVRRDSGGISTFSPSRGRPRLVVDLDVTSGAETQLLEEADADEDTILREFQTESRYDITAAPTYEVKRVYSELIDSCRGFENVTKTDEADEILKDNIATGRDLFDQMEATMSMSDSMNESQSNILPSQRRRQGLGNALSEMVMAAVHTNLCTKMLRKQTDRVGAVSNTFQLSDFVTALRDASAKDDGEYCELIAVRNLAIMGAEISHKLPPFRNSSGAFDIGDMEKVMAAEPSEPATQIKPRAPRRRDVNDKTDATRTEILDNKKDDSDDAADETTAEGLAAEIRKSVKTKYKENRNTPLNMLEIAAEGAENYYDVLSGLFGVAFNAREGWFDVSKEGDNPRDHLASLVLKPEKPPAKRAGASGDNQQRSQTIVSFPVSALKLMFAADNTSS